jgi:integral membrane protein (TIGR01906 family)
MTMKTSKLLSLLTSLLVALCLLSGAIAVPILYRPYYYSQIEALSLPARTGYSPQVIRGAFDEVMDYLVKGAPFSTGELPWSESGMAHFADCRGLFRLDFVVLGVSLALLLVSFLLFHHRVRPHRFLGRGPCFWAFIGMAVLFLAFGAWAFLDFDGLFTAFHTVFFPGKTNWVFDFRTDAIILILPEDFWARTAALVAILTLGGGLVLAILEKVVFTLTRPKTVYEELMGQHRDPKAGEI